MAVVPCQIHVDEKETLMKIAILLTQFPCLSETFILNQITGLIDRGHSVRVFARVAGNEEAIQSEVMEYKLMEITSFFSAYHEMPLGQFARMVKAIPIILRNLPKNPWAVLNALNVFKFGKEARSLRLLFLLSDFIEAGTFDVVYCQFGPNGHLGALMREAGLLKGKIVTHFHGYDLSRYLRQFGAHVYDDLFRRGDLFLVITHNFKKKLIELGCPESKINLHHMGIDTNKFKYVTREYRKDKKAFHILSVARLAEKKGLEYGIGAVAMALKKHPHIEYTIVGDGPLSSKLKNEAKENGIENKVHFLGSKNHHEVLRYLSEAHLFIAPSVTASDGDQEGVPVSIMEAMASGLPVISTFHSGIPELVSNLESGFLVPERDAYALAEKIILLIQNPDKCLEMGERGRKIVEDNFNIEILNSALVRVFEKIINESNS